MTCNANLTSSGKLTRWLLFSLITCVATATASAQIPSIGFNFASDEPPDTPAPPNDLASALLPTEVAGVVPQANWNNLTLNTGTGVTGLSYDVAGTATPSAISLSWNSPNTWRSSTNVTPVPPLTGNNRFVAGPNRKLLIGYIDTGDTAATALTITVTGIDAALRTPAYDVYVYFLGDSGDTIRGGGYTLNDGTVQVLKYGSTMNQPSAFVEDPGNDPGNTADGTHLKFSGITGSSFTLTADATLTTPPGQPNGFRAPVNAIQIVGNSTPAVYPTLIVNTVTGAMAFKNFTTTPLTIDYYEIESATNRLNPTGWNSLSDQNLDTGLPADFNNSGGAVDGNDLAAWKTAFATNGNADANGDGDSDGNDFLTWQRQVGKTPGEGDSWDEAGVPNSSLLAEVFLNGSTTVQPGQQISLGNGFVPGSNGDLAFRYGRKGSTALELAQVQYVTTGPSSTVPEPSSLAISLLALAGLVGASRRRRAA